jgi:hypothetical protein
MPRAEKNDLPDGRRSPSSHSVVLARGGCRLRRRRGSAHREQSSQQEGVFITEEQGRTIEHTEKQRLWRFAQESDQTPREAQTLAYSVDSIFLPCSSVIKTPYYLIDSFIIASLLIADSFAVDRRHWSADINLAPRHQWRRNGRHALAVARRSDRLRPLPPAVPTAQNATPGRTARRSIFSAPSIRGTTDLRTTVCSRRRTR